jgi:disulfide bond formation protein DsbB
MGVGPGTIAVCAFGVVGLLICFFKDCSETPSLMVAAGIILPLLVLLIIWFIPKQSLRTDTEKEDKLPTDAFRIRTGIFSALIFLVCILVSLLMCVGKMTTLTGSRVDSEQADISNAKRLKNI